MGRALSLAAGFLTLAIGSTLTWASQDRSIPRAQPARFTNLHVPENSDWTYGPMGGYMDPTDRIIGPEGHEVTQGSLIGSTERQLSELLGKPTSADRTPKFVRLHYAQVNRTTRSGYNGASTLIVVLIDGRAFAAGRESELTFDISVLPDHFTLRLRGHKRPRVCLGGDPPR